MFLHLIKLDERMLLKLLPSRNVIVFISALIMRFCSNKTLCLSRGRSHFNICCVNLNVRVKFGGKILVCVFIIKERVQNLY